AEQIIILSGFHPLLGSILHRIAVAEKQDTFFCFLLLQDAKAIIEGILNAEFLQPGTGWHYGIKTFGILWRRQVDQIIIGHAFIVPSLTNVSLKGASGLFAGLRPIHLTSPEHIESQRGFVIFIV